MRGKGKTLRVGSILDAAKRSPQGEAARRGRRIKSTQSSPPRGKTSFLKPPEYARPPALMPGLFATGPGTGEQAGGACESNTTESLLPTAPVARVRVDDLPAGLRFSRRSLPPRARFQFVPQPEIFKPLQSKQKSIPIRIREPPELPKVFSPAPACLYRVHIVQKNNIKFPSQEKTGILNSYFSPPRQGKDIRRLLHAAHISLSRHPQEEQLHESGYALIFTEKPSQIRAFRRS